MQIHFLSASLTLCSCFGYTFAHQAELAMGLRSFFLFQMFVSVLCHIILSFPKQHPPSRCSARIQRIAQVSSSSWLVRLIQEEILAVSNCSVKHLIYLLSYSPWGLCFNLLLVVGKFLLLLGSAANPLFQSPHLLFPWPGAAIAALSCASGSSKLIKPILSICNKYCGIWSDFANAAMSFRCLTFLSLFTSV